MNFPTLSETMHIKGKTQKVAARWKETAVDLAKTEIVKKEWVKPTLPSPPPKEPLLWWEYNERAMFDSYCVGYPVSWNYAPAEGPMDAGTASARFWNDVEEKWQQMRPSASLARIATGNYMERREAELRLRGGDALVKKWRSSMLCF